MSRQDLLLVQGLIPNTFWGQQSELIHVVKHNVTHQVYLHKQF